MIIKHHENLSDVGTIEAIQENIYMQCFLGLPSFKTESVFAPSLFVEIRKRLGADYWNEINEIIIKHNTPMKKDNDEPTSTQESNDEKIEPPANKGIINIDATIVEQDIQYPTDLGILNESREKLEELIDVICNKTGQTKPRLYRITARKHYLNVAKKKKRTYKIIRKAVGQQLGYVNRNLKLIEILLPYGKPLAQQKALAEGIASGKLSLPQGAMGTRASTTKIATAAQIGGKVLVVAGAAMSIHHIITADDKGLAVSQEAGGYAGAWAGAEGGAVVGAAIGVWFGGVGAAPGALIGGFIGGIGGYFGGYEAGGAIYEATKE